MIIKAAAGLTVVAVGWMAVLAGTMAGTDTAPAALIPFPSETFMNALPADIAIANITPVGVILISENTDYVAQLYAAGARIVLPAGLRGCDPNAPPFSGQNG